MVNTILYYKHETAKLPDQHGILTYYPFIFDSIFALKILVHGNEKK